MADFIDHERYIGPGQAVKVSSDTQCNIRFLADSHFYAYKNSQNYNYSGGFAVRFPVVIAPPTPGHWHVVVDLPEGHWAQIRCSVEVVNLTN